MRTTLLAVLALLAACDDGDGGSKRPPAQPPATTWELGPVIAGRNYSTGSLEVAGPAVSLYLAPDAEPHYVTMPWAAPVSDRDVVRMTYRVDGDEDVAFSPCASVTPYVQMRGDDWRTEGYRWWATFATKPLSLGEHEITAPLDGNWTSTETFSAATHPAQFAAAKARLGRVGFTFGDCTGYGHGAKADRAVRFTLTSFEIRP